MRNSNLNWINISAENSRLGKGERGRDRFMLATSLLSVHRGDQALCVLYARLRQCIIFLFSSLLLLLLLFPLLLSLFILSSCRTLGLELLFELLL